MPQAATHDRTSEESSSCVTNGIGIGDTCHALMCSLVGRAHGRRADDGCPNKRKRKYESRRLRPFTVRCSRPPAARKFASPVLRALSSPRAAAHSRGESEPLFFESRGLLMKMETRLIAAFTIAMFVAMTVGMLPASAGHETDESAVVRSAKSGLWSAPASWEGGKVPAAGARVLIRAGHRIVYDLHSEQAIRGINVAGILSFATDKDTRLDVGLIKIQAADEYSEEGFDCDAHVGPVDASKPAARAGGRHARKRRCRPSARALIRLVYFPGMDKELLPGHRLLRRPHGLPRRAAEPNLGQARRDRQEGRQHRHARRDRHRLESRRSGHRPGHRVSWATRIDSTTTEERFIQAIDGAKITLDQPLEVHAPRRRAATGARSPT